MTTEAETDGGQSLFVDRRGGVTVLTLNRPARRNALDRALRRALRKEFATAEADDDVRVIIVTGAGSAFSSGVDLSEALTGPATAPEGATPTQVMRSLSKPVIAAVNGPCFTGGLELAVSCSFIIASEEAVFADTHTSIGLIDGWGGSAMLPRIVGLPMATQIMLTGNPVDAQTALRIGLANEVVPADRLMERTLEIAESIAAAHPEATRRLLRLLNDGAGSSTAHALGLEAEAAATWRPNGAEIRRRFSTRTQKPDQT